MSTGTPSAGAKALSYAENNLKVHRVYEDAVGFRNALDKTFNELSEARDTKRDLDLRLSDAEMEVAAEERGKHPEMSAAAMDKHLKVALSKDDTVRELREQHAKAVGDIEGLEFDKAIQEADIKIAVARLQELGGYFYFLAAVKQADTAKLASEALKNEGEQQ